MAVNTAIFKFGQPRRLLELAFLVCVGSLQSCAMAHQMIAQFVALCEATTGFLRDVPADQLAGMTQQHVQNIETNLNRFAGRPEVLQPQVLQAVNSLPLPAAEKHRLALKISSLAANVNPANGSFQNWTCWPGYVLKDAEAELRDKNMTSEARVQKVVSDAYQAGLRSPSEPTFQALTALFLHLNGTVDMNPYEKKDALDEVKKAFRRLGGLQLERLVANLPASHGAFRDMAPRTFVRCFGSDPVFAVIEPNTVDWILSIASIVW